MTETMMPVNGIQVCVETFGEPSDAPLLLLAGDASSMDWWDDEFCRRLAAGTRFVIRYDHRDTGRSTCFPIGSPGYSAADLTDDALGVLDVLGLPAAHLVGFALGGAIAQRMAVEHPDRVLSLTLISTSAGPPDPAPVPHAKAVPHAKPVPPAKAARPSKAGPTSKAAPPQKAAPPPGTAPQGTTKTAVVTRALPAAEIDWTDRKAAVTRLIAEIRDRGGPFTADEPHLRRLAERVFDRTADLAAGRHNHRQAGYGPTVRDRLGAVTAPTLVLHGTLDQRFPAEHPRELAGAIPGARLVWLEGVGHEFPPRAVWETVLSEILETPA